MLPFIALLSVAVNLQFKKGKRDSDPFIEGVRLNKTLQSLDIEYKYLGKVLQINAQNQNLTFLNLVFLFHFLKLALSHFHPVPLMLLTHSGTQKNQIFR